MKSEAVDCWIKHWLQLQNKGKWPLVLKNASDKQQKSSDVEGRLTSKHKGKMKATETTDSESDNVDKPADGTVNVDDDHQSDQDSGGAANKRPSPHPAHNLPASPLSADLNRTTCWRFLKSLSNNKNYQRLLLLLQAAQVCIVSLSKTCTNYLSRVATCSKLILPLGSPGSRWTIFFLLHSSTRHQTSRYQPSTSGLPQTPLQLRTITWCHINSLSTLPSDLGLHFELCGLRNFQIAVTMFLLIFLRVHTHSHNTNNFPIKLKTSSLGTKKRM